MDLFPKICIRTQNHAGGQHPWATMDDMILNVAPSYVTDALVRKVNVTRYDDREIIRTNLIESYE